MAAEQWESGCVGGRIFCSLPAQREQRRQSEGQCPGEKETVDSASHKPGVWSEELPGQSIKEGM